MKEEYVLGIHSNVAPSAGFIDGHAWITIVKKIGSGRAIQSYGLWPDDHPRTKDNGNKSDVRIGMEPTKALANRYYALDLKQRGELRHLIATKDHWFYTNNCSSWVSKIVYKFLKTDIDADDWLGIETPRELSKTILKLEKIDPTTIEKPKAIIWKLTRRGYRKAS